jgi:hypothetical protein
LGALGPLRGSPIVARRSAPDPLGELVREFLLVQNERVQFANPKPRFVYYREKYPDLDSMVDILEDAGFVADITTGGIKTYRMSNEFIELLRSTS